MRTLYLIPLFIFSLSLQARAQSSATLELQAAQRAEEAKKNKAMLDKYELVCFERGTDKSGKTIAIPTVSEITEDCGDFRKRQAYCEKGSVDAFKKAVAESFADKQDSWFNCAIDGTLGEARNDQLIEFSGKCFLKLSDTPEVTAILNEDAKKYLEMKKYTK